MKTGNLEPFSFKTNHTSNDHWPWGTAVNTAIYDPSIEWPRITIVTPSFNQGDYIESTIRSVLAQNYPNLQYIVIDGGSTDQTVQIIKHYEEHIDYWISEKDNGQSEAINKGLRKSKGVLFNWLNSDDLLEKNALFKIAIAYLKNNAECIIGDCRHFNNIDDSTIAIGQTQLSENTEKTIWRLGMGQPSTFYTTQFVKEMKGLNEQLHYAMDTNLWYQFLTLKGIEKVQYIPEILSHFRIHDGSKTIASESFFIKDVNAIRYSLLQACKCPEIVLNFFSNPINKNYHSNWFLEKIDTKKLVGYFAHYVGTEYYTTFNYTSAVQCFKIALDSGITSESTLKQYFKVKFIPSFILNSLRKWH